MTKYTSDNSFLLLEKYKHLAGEIIVVGCLPDTHTQRLHEVFNGKIISAKNLDQIDDFFPENTIKFKDIAESNKLLEIPQKKSYTSYMVHLEEKFSPTRSLTSFLMNQTILKITGNLVYKTYPFNFLFIEPSNYYILISRGCNHHCAYCIVGKGIGPLKSKPIQDCVEEFKRGLDQGYTSFVLEADDIGPYGIDIGSTLPDLLKQLTALEGHYTIELRNTHPYWILKYQSALEDIIATKKITTFFVSIQSGSDQILDRMKRHYKAADVTNVIQKFKTRYPELKIGVDILVGFPTETREDFEKTLAMVDLNLFDYGDIIPFSCHKATDAYHLEPKVPEEETRQRIQETFRFLRKRKYFAMRMNSGSISFYARE